MKRLLIFILEIAISISASANSGETGFSFLKIGGGARPAGLGEAGVALYTDAAAAYWNPAGLAMQSQNNILFTYNRWIEGVNHNFFSAKFVSGNHALAFHFISTGVDGIEQREIPSENPTAYFSSHDMAIGISYAQKFNANWSIGITTKYIYERIQNAVHALAFDLGVWHNIRYAYDNPAFVDRWRVGLSITNIGFSGKLVDEKIKLPAAVRAGSSFDILRNEKNRLTLAMDVIKPFSDNIRFNAGSEYGFRDYVFLRTGYQWSNDTRSFSAGLGVKMIDKIRIDYGLTVFNNSLGMTHRISAGFDF